MALFFSGAVTSSPIRQRRRRRATQPCQSLDTSLLSPDSSYVCYSPGSASGGPCSCRRSARLLTNGYYSVTEDSFSWDEDGNVSLSPCTTSVSYKENLVRIFRRRRRPRGTLAGLLSDVTDSCQSWLDQKVFRGMFGTGHNRNQDQDQDLNLDLNWEPRGSERAPPLEETPWSPIKPTEVEETREFTFDHTEIPHPSDKVAPPPDVLAQEEICSEAGQSEEPFTHSVGGLSEVPPLLSFYSCSCQTPPERPGATVKTLVLLLFLATFVLTALLSWCHTWTTAVASTTFVTVISFLLTARLSRSMGSWRAAKTEDITSRNE